MSEPFAEFDVRCASCGGRIEELADGWVEWLEEDDGRRLYGIRVVHKGKRCQYDRLKVGGDHHLSHFVGGRGLVRLAGLITGKHVEGTSFAALLAVLAGCVDMTPTWSPTEGVEPC